MPKPASVLLCIGFVLWSASALRATTSSKHDRKSHHHHASLHHHGHGAEPAGRKLSTEEALELVPAEVSNVFAEFQEAPDATKAASALEQLNTVYTRARLTKDTMGPKCMELKSELEREVGGAQHGLLEVESQLTQSSERMQGLETGMERSLAEVESLRDQFRMQRFKCNNNIEKQKQSIALLRKDVDSAKEIQIKVTTGCNAAGGVPPKLVECTLPDGAYVTTFKDVTLRNSVSQLSGVSQRLVALHLHRAAHPSPVAATPEAPVFMQTNSSHHKHKAHHVSLMQKLLESKQIPANLCADAKPPKCEAFNDDIATFVGNVGDLIDEINERSQADDEHCHRTLSRYINNIKEFKRQADDASVTLVNTVAAQSQLTALKRGRKTQYVDSRDNAKQEFADCMHQLSDADHAICGIRKLRNSLDAILGSSAGVFSGDCEVSEWVLGPCSQRCGFGGKRTLSREMVNKPADPSTCPALSATTKCNEKACPVDGQMNAWEDWSSCTRDCGGGTRTRHRKIIRRPENDGLPLGETGQEQLCNARKCDQDCQLSEWSEWTACSKQCNGGHRARSRMVVRGAVGDGSCPAERDTDRLDRASCNVTKCASEAPKCASKLDVIFLVDSSGSVGEEGFNAFKAFTTMVAARMNTGDVNTGSQVGAVAFSGTPTVVQALSSDAPNLAAMAWQKATTNTGAALAVARAMLQDVGRPGATPVVVVVSDGSPISSHIVTTEADRLKEQGVRLSFVTVGGGIAESALEKWSSWPKDENIVKVRAYGDLIEKVATRLIVNLCPVLA